MYLFYLSGPFTGLVHASYISCLELNENPNNLKVSSAQLTPSNSNKERYKAHDNK